MAGTKDAEARRPNKCNFLREDGSRCKSWPAKGRKRCRRHGGQALVGIHNPAYKDGSASKYDFPVALKSTLDKVQRGKNFLNMHDELELVDVRIQGLLERLDTGESSTAWQQAQFQLNLLRAAAEEEDMEGIRLAVGEMSRVIEQGRDENETWEKILAAVQHRRSMIDSETKRAELQGQMLTAESALAMVLRLVRIAEGHLTPSAHRELIYQLKDEIGIFGGSELIDVTPDN